MNPWKEAQTGAKRAHRSRTWPAAEIALITTLAALVATALAMLWLNRFESAQFGTVPSRLNRITGEVIGCLPGQGCIQLIPPGEPNLRPATIRRGSASPMMPSAPASATAASPPAK